MQLTRPSYESKSDEYLMKMVQKGTKKAFEGIYDRYAGRMTSYFYRMLWQDKEKALDFTHDLFMKIIDKPHYFDTNRNFKTWLYSVANNMCKNEYKRNENHKTHNTDLEGYHHLHSEQPKEGNLFDSGSFYNSLMIELNKIEKNQRETFLLRYFDEMSIREISQTQDISEGTVKSRLFYTLKKITPGLKEFELLKNDSLNFQRTRS